MAEWSSLKLLLLGLRGYLPDLHGLQEARELGDQLKGAHMHLKVVIVHRGHQSSQETYHGMSSSLSKAAPGYCLAATTEPFLIGAMVLLNIFVRFVRS